MPLLLLLVLVLLRHLLVLVFLLLVFLFDVGDRQPKATGRMLVTFQAGSTEALPPLEALALGLLEFFCCVDILFLLPGEVTAFGCRVQEYTLKVQCTMICESYCGLML